MKSPLAALILIPLALGCGDETTADPDVTGQACSVAAPCPEAWLCVRGACVTRFFPGDIGARDTRVTPIEIVPGPTDADDNASDVVADAGPADTDGPALDAGDVGDAAAPDDGADAAVTVLWVGNHTGLEDPSDDKLTLQAEQGVVAELVVGAAGRATALEALLVEPIGGAACAHYRPTVWVAEGEGSFPAAPLYSAPSVAVVASDVAQRIAFADPPTLPGGRVRAGLVYERTCNGYARQPNIVIDASGQTQAAWIWARLGETANWISATGLGLSGRFALRLEVTVP